MKHAPPSLTSVLAGAALALAPSLLCAQGKGAELRQLRAPDKPPPEVTRAPRGPDGPMPDAAPAKLLEQIASRPGGREQLDAAKAGKGQPLPVAGRPPHDPRHPLPRSSGAAALPGQPSRGELLEVISRQPNGKAKIEAAEGARGGGKGGGFLNALAVLSPLHTDVAEAQSYSCVVTPKSPMGSACGVNYFAVARLYSMPEGYLVAFANSVAQLDARIPTAGWHIVNFQSYGAGAARIQHWNGSSWADIQAFTDGTLGGHNHPALLNLAAGDHFLRFLVTSGAYWLGITQLSGF